MKFRDKLAKQRKDNNLSQEQLADKLGVSRQAVSKWELGQSYPDMDKMIQMCKILNCTLEELMDDGTIAGSSNPKFSITNYFNDFLKFMTKTYNMICSMTFREKMKCFLEMSFLIIIIILIGAVAFEVITSIIHNILYILPEGIKYYIFTIIDSILLLGLIILGIITVVHIFKIRYLDYFITIEDNNTKEKVIEEPIEKKENKQYVQKSREKIIIRDPKHSTYSFIDVLGKTVMFFMKCFLIFITIPCIFIFIGLVFMVICSIWLIKNGLIFLGITIAIMGCIIVNYLVLKMLYNFIFEQKNNFRRIFLLFIIGLILVGSGLGVSICNYMSFDKVSDNKSNIKYLSATEEIDIKDDLILDFLYHGSATLVVDNNISNIKIDIEYPEKSKYHLYNYQSRYYPGDYEYNRSNYNIYNHYDLSCYNDYDFIEEFNEVLNDIKNKERKNYVYDYECRIKITTSLDNINKLKSNYSVMYDY